jgi:hypothetical protein
MGQIAKLPTRRELIHFGVWVLLGLSIAALAALHIRSGLPAERRAMRRILLEFCTDDASKNRLWVGLSYSIEWDGGRC